MADNIIDGDRQDKFDISFEDLDKLLDSTFTDLQEGGSAGGTSTGGGPTVPEAGSVGGATAGPPAAAPEEEADLSALLAAAGRALNEPRPAGGPGGDPVPETPREPAVSVVAPTPDLVAAPEPAPLVMELPEAALPALATEGGAAAPPEPVAPLVAAAEPPEPAIPDSWSGAETREALPLEPELLMAPPPAAIPEPLPETPAPAPLVAIPEPLPPSPPPEPLAAIPEPPTGQLPAEPLISDDQLANLLAELGEPPTAPPPEPVVLAAAGPERGEAELSAAPVPAPVVPASAGPERDEAELSAAPVPSPTVPAPEAEDVRWPEVETGVIPEPVVPSVAAVAAAVAARRETAAAAPTAAEAAATAELPLAEQAVRQLKAQRYEAAIRILKRLIEEEGMNPDHYFNLSVACTRKRDLAGARAALERALEIDPRYWRAMGNLAGLEFEAGNVAAAEKLLRQAIEVNPFDANSRQNLRFIRRQQSGGRTAGSVKKGRAR